jgi:alpha-glucosidase (family GH31 glycosyl hydrolase)
MRRLGEAGAGALVPVRGQAEDQEIRIAGRSVEITLTPVSPETVRISVTPIENGRPATIRSDGSLVKAEWGPAVATFRRLAGHERFRCGDLMVHVAPDPLQFRIETENSRLVQQLQIDAANGSLTFQLGDGPVLGLGEGGPQFDRRGWFDAMKSGQGGYHLHTHGGRVPIPWMIGTSGWAMFLHQPYGSFDLRGKEGRFDPEGSGSALPLDLFVVAAREPAAVLAEYARLTGFPEMPPLWTFGYQQSHRTLAGPEEVLAIADTFRQKRLPCDALIYLGTGFCPSGWNTANGSFAFNSSVFADPAGMIRQLHARNFHIVLHAVILADKLHGTARDTCELARFDEQEASCQWDMHRKDFALGVDGWWPDEGDDLNAAARLTRNRMYWEGPQIDRPNRRPYALHRNGYAGMQRYGSLLWSGDVYSTWETLRTHVSIGINTGLTGIPYWGTDTGGFVPTLELTGELYVRWFQFSSFCPLFRSHGRSWKLRLPWGWNTGSAAPSEIANNPGAADPDPSELHNARVEPICRKYLELRYRLMPYLYAAVREAQQKGLPIMRALWLHYPADARAVSTGDEYLWGRDILVAPVTEKGATSRRVYLPPGDWYDFWTNERIEGGREITREVDLETMPLYIRAGAILPLGPVRQYTTEKVDGPLTFAIYSGADAEFIHYEDDGTTFNYRRGEWMGLRTAWDDRERVFRAGLQEGSRMRPPLERQMEVHRVPESKVRKITFFGPPLRVQL